MGNKKSKELPQEIKEKALKLFCMIDVDGSKTIDREETLRFWKKNFAKLNTEELFQAVDKNNDGSIQLEEWMEFWLQVYTSGHSVDEISYELDNLANGNSWVKFENVENLNKKSGNLERRKTKEGKGKY